LLWWDGKTPASTSGYRLSDVPGWLRVPVFFAQPFKRSWLTPWFGVIVRVGRIGSEELYLTPDPADRLLEASIKPTRDGELFLYVNDMIVAVPGMSDLFYRNNGGTAKVTITRTR
jgi:hypothetical protein